MMKAGITQHLIIFLREIVLILNTLDSRSHNFYNRETFASSQNILHQ